MIYATAPDGARLAMEVVGSGEPLLLISGQGLNRHLWDAIRHDFSDRHRVVTFDHRGTGESDKPQSPPYSIRIFVGDVLAVLNAVDAPRAHAYGFSMGGRITQVLAAEHPERVGALVLGGTTPGNAHGVARSPEVDAKMAHRPTDPEETVRDSLERMVTPAWAAAHPEYADALREGVRRYPVPPYAQRMHYAASEGHDSWDLLPRITAPTLVIHGELDRVNPAANAGLLAERIAGAQLHIVAGAGHAYLIDHREEASRTVKDFLLRHPIASFKA